MRGCSRTVSKRGWSLCHHGRFLNTRPKSIERAYCRQTSKRALPSSRPLPSDGSATWVRKVVSSVCTHLGLLRRSKSCKKSSALSPIKLSRWRRNFWPENKSVQLTTEADLLRPIGTFLCVSGCAMTRKLLVKQPKQIAFLVDVDDTSDQRVTPCRRRLVGFKNCSINYGPANG